MRYFCTYFDQNYLPRGLALYRSLKQHCGPFQLWVLCLDHQCLDVLSRFKLPEVRSIALEDFECGDEALAKAKENRTRIEYYFTCTPSLPLFILNRNPEADLITYLDADLFFFSDPSPVYQEIGNNSIAITGHRFSLQLQELERYGIYNVGWLTFRNDERGRACLHWWRERCLEWCYDRCEDGRFADQKYLDDWPTRFPGTIVLTHKGANLAPWNLARYSIQGDAKGVWVDEDPLMFFHFHGFKQLTSCLYDPNLEWYGTKPSNVVKRTIYAPYIRTFSEVCHQVSPFLQQPSLRSSPRYQTIERQGYLRWMKRAQVFIRTTLNFLKRYYILVIDDRVF